MSATYPYLYRSRTGGGYIFRRGEGEFLKERSDHCVLLLNFPPLMALLIEVLLGEPIKGENSFLPCAQGCRRQIGLEDGGLRGAMSAAILKEASAGSRCHRLEDLPVITASTVLENRGGNRCVSRPANAALA